MQQSRKKESKSTMDDSRSAQTKRSMWKNIKQAANKQRVARKRSFRKY